MVSKKTSGEADLFLEFCSTFVGSFMSIFSLSLLLFCWDDLSIFRLNWGIVVTFLSSEDFLCHIKPLDATSNRFWGRQGDDNARGTSCIPARSSSSTSCSPSSERVLLDATGQRASKSYMSQMHSHKSFFGLHRTFLACLMVATVLQLLEAHSSWREQPARSSPLMSKECCRFCWWHPGWYFAPLQ